MLAVNVDPKYLTIEQVTRAHKHSTILPPSRAIYILHVAMTGNFLVYLSRTVFDSLYVFCHTLIVEVVSIHATHALRYD